MAEMKILIMDRGHVRIAWIEPHPEKAFHYRLVAARCIRRWGTTEGLAELADDGPTASTVLDRLHTSSVPWRAVIEVIDVTEKGEAAWRKHLEGRPNATAKRR